MPDKFVMLVMPDDLDLEYEVYGPFDSEQDAEDWFNSLNYFKELGCSHEIHTLIPTNVNYLH